MDIMSGVYLTNDNIHDYELVEDNVRVIYVSPKNELNVHNFSKNDKFVVQIRKNSETEKWENIKAIVLSKLYENKKEIKDENGNDIDGHHYKITNFNTTSTNTNANKLQYITPKEKTPLQMAFKPNDRESVKKIYILDSLVRIAMQKCVNDLGLKMYINKRRLDKDTSNNLMDVKLTLPVEDNYYESNMYKPQIYYVPAGTKVSAEYTQKTDLLILRPKIYYDDAGYIINNEISITEENEEGHMIKKIIAKYNTYNSYGKQIKCKYQDLLEILKSDNLYTCALGYKIGLEEKDQKIKGFTRFYINKLIINIDGNLQYRKQDNDEELDDIMNELNDMTF